jgi:sigma-54 dependent transcriptional regulator, acetoin dehydrogenase operon transcriptional activator AcoR
MMKEQEIRQGWERFIENGTISKALRGVVVASWRRSQSHGIPVERNEAPLAPEAELVQRRSAHAALLEAARPALNQVCLFLGEANSMIILTDSSGLVLETLGDPRTIDLGQQINLELGGSWKEADIGTNAIGTAIAESRPVQIHGLEHFCSDVKRWTVQPRRFGIQPAVNFWGWSISLGPCEPLTRKVLHLQSRWVARSKARLLSRSNTITSGYCAIL